MVMYLALRLEGKKLNYNSVFRKSLYKQFQNDVDIILETDGYVVGEDGWCVKGVSNDDI